MTLAQQFRLRGALASMRVRGVEATFDEGSGPATLTVLIPPAAPDTGRGFVDREVSEAAEIHALKSDIADLLDPVVIGSVFTIDGRTYRVTEIKDDPANVLAVFKCEIR